MSQTTEKVSFYGTVGLLLKKYLGQISLVGVGAVIAALIFPFVCGTTSSVIKEVRDTLHVDHYDTTQVPMPVPYPVYVAGKKGTPQDSSDCPLFSIQYIIDGDTITMLGIRAKDQSIDTLIYSKHADSLLVIHHSDTITIHDSVTIVEHAKIAALGYEVAPFLSTQDFGIAIDGRIKDYHLQIGPNVNYLQTGSFLKKFGVKAQFRWVILQSAP